MDQEIARKLTARLNELKDELDLRTAAVEKYVDFCAVSGNESPGMAATLENNRAAAEEELRMVLAVAPYVAQGHLASRDN